MYYFIYYIVIYIYLFIYFYNLYIDNVEKRIQEDNLQHLALFSEYGRMALDKPNEWKKNAVEVAQQNRRHWHMWLRRISKR